MFLNITINAWDRLVQSSGLCSVLAYFVTDMKRTCCIYKNLPLAWAYDKYKREKLSVGEKQNMLDNTNIKSYDICFLLQLLNQNNFICRQNIKASSRYA